MSLSQNLWISIVFLLSLLSSRYQQKTSRVTNNYLLCHMSLNYQISPTFSVLVRFFLYLLVKNTYSLDIIYSTNELGREGKLHLVRYESNWCKHTNQCKNFTFATWLKQKKKYLHYKQGSVLWSFFLICIWKGQGVCQVVYYQVAMVIYQTTMCKLWTLVR